MGKKPNSKRVQESEAMAVGRSIRSGARRLNLVAQLIRGKKAEDALRELTFCKRRSAGEVKKVLQSAISNAENNHGLDVDSLHVVEASVGRAIVMKRFHARAKGRAGRIEKPFSRLTIVVGELAAKAVEQTKAKKEKSGEV